MKEYKVTKDRGTTRWYNLQGQLHREDGPAVEYSDGSKSWYLNGKRHREDGPAVEYSDGDKEWKEWFLNGQRHRTDGPAVEDSNGTKVWYLNGKRHREDGPAVEYSDGPKQWWLNDKPLTETEWLKKTRTKPSCDGRVVEIEGVKYKLEEIKTASTY